MPSLFSHPAVPLCIGLALGAARVPPRLLLLGVAVAILPDADVLAFRLGIPYADAFGHRGASHSLLAALLLGAMAACCSRLLRADWRIVLPFVTVAAASHGLLDMLTNGGLGVALWWPASDARLFFPWQPVQVSPIGAANFFSARGARVFASELLWIWLPCLLIAASARLARART